MKSRGLLARLSASAGHAPSPRRAVAAAASTASTAASSTRFVVAKAILVALVAVGLVAAVGVSPAVAQDDSAASQDHLVVKSDTTFTADPDAGQLIVRQTFTVINDKEPVVSESSIEDFFFTNFSFVLLADSIDLAVTVDGVVASTSREPVETSPQIDVATVAFPERIGFSESVDVFVTYVVPSGDARTDDPVRVTNSYLAFPLYVCCDAGRINLRVVVPQDFELDIQGDQKTFVRSQGIGTTILEQEVEGDPETFNAFLFGRNDAELAVSSVAIGDDTVRIEAWLDDPDWATFVADSVTKFVPILEGEIGQSWPEGDLSIVETTTPYLFGYAAWYRHRDSIIEVGEQLEERVLVHELTHAWVSDELFDSRWINEGLAEYFTSRALEVASGFPDVAQPPDDGSLYAQPLNQWGRPPGIPSAVQEEQEAYGYNASWYVMEAIVTEIGPEGLIAVLDAARNGEVSFVAGDQIEADPNAWASWQRFMDLVQERGGFAEVDEVFRSFVATPEQSAMLDVRTETHQRYNAFQSGLDGWSAPLGVRTALTTWSFDEAISLMAAAEATMADSRQAIDTQATALDLPVLPAVREAFAASRTLEDLDATRSIAERQLAGLALVQEATELVASNRDWATTLGLQGRDVDQLLADARAAYEVDDLAAVTTTTLEIRTALATAPSAGRQTALLVVLIIVGVLALIAMAIGGRRRRRREPLVTLPPEVERAEAPLVPQA